MQFILIAAMSLIIFLSATTLSSSAKVDHSAASADAVIAVDQYRMFIFVAAQYMRTIATPPPSVTTVSWETMAQSSVAPPGSRDLKMPQGWRVVQAVDGSWVACTEMDERPIGGLSQLLPASSSPSGTATATGPQFTPVTLSSGGSSTSFVVIGTPTAAVTLAALCN